MSSNHSKDPGAQPAPHVPASDHQRAEQGGANDESIQQVHAILLREKAEPHEGFSPMPLFLLGIISALILVCAIYVVHYRGDFDPLVYDHRYDAEAAKAAAAAPKELTPEQILAKGKQAYQTCVTCHQANGLGVPGAFPPLAGSEWVTGKEDRLVRVVLHGLGGPIQVKGSTFNGAMPAFGKVPGGGYNWNAEKIAQVLSYIRHEWGNNAGFITKEKVDEIFKAEAARSKVWTQDELKKFE
jgi:mono/diheme cytochrome c family protein